MINLAVMAAGSILSMVGRQQASVAQERAHRANADFVRAQRRYITEATQKEARVFQTSSNRFLGTQLNAYSKTGVNMSGSALLAITQTRGATQREYRSILEQGEQRLRQLNLQARSHLQAANTIRANRPLEFMSGLLGHGGSLLGQIPTAPQQQTLPQLMGAGE